MLSPDILARMKEIVGPHGFIADSGDMASYLSEPRGLYHGRTPVVLKPGSTEELAQLMEIAFATGTPVVPQGGNTGLVGGQIPAADGNEIVISLSRMNRLRTLDTANNTMIVEAGMTLAAAQTAAEEADRLFPLSLASEGSCQIGGNLASNAGGTAVLRYGNARELVLGLEVVLADGRIWSGLNGLRKDNTGYDLKQIFVGSEGTLGIITAAVLKLFPKPRAIETAFVAVPNIEAAVRLLRLMDGETGGLVTGFELMPRIGLDFVLKHVNGMQDPLSDPWRWYVLVELTAGKEGPALGELMEAALAMGFEQNIVTDAAIAQSETQRTLFWRLRENMSDVQKLEGGSIKHDISVPISSVPAFISRAAEAVEAALPGIRPVIFGHIGDGNIHFNLSQPVGMNKDAFLDLWSSMSHIVHGIVREFGGSISAEHGVGQMKRDEIATTKSPVEMDLMRTLKHALDPKGILNPGKVLSA